MIQGNDTKVKQYYISREGVSLIRQSRIFQGLVECFQALWLVSLE